MQYFQITGIILTLLLACACSKSTEPSHAQEASPHQATHAETVHAQQAEAPQSACTDKSCFPCAESFCLPGSICVIEDKIGSCIWLEACSQRPTCDCALRVLDSGCTCSGVDEAPTLSCSSQ